MEDCILEAREELKRLEHIIYVSLKYTRTVDVILNALRRIVGTYDMIIAAFLERAKEEGKVTILPKSPALKSKLLLEILPEDENLKKYLVFYHYLKNILNNPYKKREEFRRHVTLIVELENSTTEINIDNLLNSEKYIHQFFSYVWDTLIGKPEEDDF